MGEHERAGVQGSVCTTAILTRQCPLWVDAVEKGLVILGE